MTKNYQKINSITVVHRKEISRTTEEPVTIIYKVLVIDSLKGTIEWGKEIEIPSENYKYTSYEPNKKIKIPKTKTPPITVNPIKEIGRFTGISFDNTVYEFIVSKTLIINSNTQTCKLAYRIACPKVHPNYYEQVVLKPRFDMINYETRNHKPLSINGTDGLIAKYEIDPELFSFLSEFDLISYSTDMAYLYGFDKEVAFDIGQNKRAFKYLKKTPAEILKKQKQGKFN